MDSVLIHVSFLKAYEFEGCLFEYDRNKPFPPWPLKKDHEPKKLAGRKFFDLFGRFNELTLDEQEKYRVI